MNAVIEADPRLAIGGNNPPEPTPFEAASEEIEDLFTEASNWLDGAGVQSQKDADAVSKLLDMARKAEKRADAARTEEKRPHDEAAKAVQAKYKPLLDRAKLVADTCKQALQPYLLRLEAEKRAQEEAARREAEEKQRIAQEAIRAAAAADIAKREKAEALLAEAKAAEAALAKATKDKAHATGGTRAVGLRTVYEAVLTDETAFARYLWKTHRDEMVTYLRMQAARLVAAKFRDIPGVEVIERKEAV